MNARDANDRLIREAARVAQQRLTALEARAAHLEAELAKTRIDEAVMQAQIEDTRADMEQVKAQLRVFAESMRDLLD